MSSPFGDWWRNDFSPDERAAIENAFRPLGETTVEQMLHGNDPNQIGLLVGHLKKAELRNLGYRLLNRGDSFVSSEVRVLSLHFYFASRGDYFYRWRDLDAFALDEAVASFQRQIGVAVSALSVFRESKIWGGIPAHAGYRQLRIIEEKRGNLTLARALCEQAKLEGWADDWDHHIGRINKKLSKIL